MKDRVLRYKLDRYVASGKPAESAEVVAAALERPHDLYVIASYLRGRGLLVESWETGYRSRSTEPRECTMDDLVKYAGEIVQHRGWDGLEQYREYYGGGACACMGPRDGEPLCGCQMRIALHKHLDDVLLRLADQRHGDI